MRGPFLPIYGSGAIMMLVVSMPFHDNVVLTYVAGFIGATALEYVTGVVMEALFKVRYWDYSKKKFNFQGHICLGSSIAWGFFTIIMTEHVQVRVERIVFSIPEQALTIVTVVLTALIFSDFSLSFKAAIDLRIVLERMEQAKDEMARIQRRLDVLIALTGEELENRRQELNELKTRYAVNLEKRNSLSNLKDFFQRDLIRANPTMTSVKFKEALEEIRLKAGKMRPENKQ
jgi:uncharacterized membrane protein